MADSTSNTSLVVTALKGVVSSPPASGPMQRIEQHPQWMTLARLPLKLTVAIPVSSFRVSDLVRLRPGQTLKTAWQSSEDVPLRVGGVQLGWSEFEVVEQRMAVRLTRLS